MATTVSKPETLFGKREPNSPTPNSPLNAATPGTQPGGMSSAVKPAPTPSGMGPSGASGAAPAPVAPAPASSEGGSKLIVDLLLAMQALKQRLG